MRTPTPLKLRTALYGLILVGATLQAICGAVAGNLNGPGFLTTWRIYGNIVAGLGVIISMWTGVLFGYNNNPLSIHALARSSSHFYSFLTFAPLSLASGVLVLMQAPSQCTYTAYSNELAGWWCVSSAAAGSFAILTGTLAGATAVVIGLAAKRSGSGLAGNITLGDGMKAQSYSSLSTNVIV